MSGCCGSVAEHWWLKPEVSWVRLPVTAGFFTFLYFCLITSKFKYSYLIDSQINDNGIPTAFCWHKTYFLLLSSLLLAHFLDSVYITTFGNIYMVTSNATLLQEARDELQKLFPSSDNFTPTTLSNHTDYCHMGQSGRV